jgi:hypothetical protein
MVAKGFQADSHDPFSAPQKPKGKFDIITCIEVVEHSTTPLTMFREMSDYLTNDGIIIVGESLQPEDIDQIQCSWWYIAPRNGHCSTFDRRTFAKIADQLGFIFRSGEFAGPHALCLPGTPRLEEIAGRIGPAIAHYRLGAPGIRSSQWHGVERPEGRRPFQWSASPDLVWTVCVRQPRSTLILDLPFEHVVADFANKCTLAVDGTQVGLHVRSKMLTGELFNASSGFRTITLHTPPPVRADGADERLIGVAMPVIETNKS